VVEKCLIISKKKIELNFLFLDFVNEIMDENQLKNLIRDPFGNYVVIKLWEMYNEESNNNDGSNSRNNNGDGDNSSNDNENVNNLDNWKGVFSKFKNALMIVLPSSRSSPFGKRLYSLVMGTNHD
jgi:hypothetical protein